MKPIKFRVYNSESKEMYAVKEFTWHHGKILFYEDEEENYTLMQYIGEKDKNGKEIYEGDIMRHRYGISPVEFEECTFWPFTPGAANSPQPEESEVIGNIHENPEMKNLKL